LRFDCWNMKYHDISCLFIRDSKLRFNISLKNKQRYLNPRAFKSLCKLKISSSVVVNKIIYCNQTHMHYYETIISRSIAYIRFNDKTHITCNKFSRANAPSTDWITSGVTIGFASPETTINWISSEYREIFGHGQMDNSAHRWCQSNRCVTVDR